jgi:hypothetical protein
MRKMYAAVGLAFMTIVPLLSPLFGYWAGDFRFAMLFAVSCLALAAGWGIIYCRIAKASDAVEIKIAHETSRKLESEERTKYQQLRNERERNAESARAARFAELSAWLTSEQEQEVKRKIKEQMLGL